MGMDQTDARPISGGRIVEIEKDLVQKLLDVEALRAVAVLLEVDPNTVVPDNFKNKYLVPLSYFELKQYREAREAIRDAVPIVPAVLSPDHQDQYPDHIIYHRRIAAHFEKRAKANNQEVE
jgi:hypothetical protein